MSDGLLVTPPRGSGIAIYPPGATYGPRVMREFEFVWMIEGDAEYRWGDHVIPAPVGSLVLCRPGATDFFAWDRRRRTRHAFFHFQVLELPADWPPDHTWPFVRQTPDDDILRPLFRHLIAPDRREQKLGQERLIVAAMLSAFVSGDMAADGLAPDAWPDPVERAWDYLHTRLEEQPDAPLTLAVLATAACVTPEHLCRLFQATVGHSPMETVRLARLDRAAMLLVRSNSTVAAVADFCGFATPFHFTRLFKQAYGLSPRDLRAAIRQGATPPVPRLLRRFRQTLPNISHQSQIDIP
jgi:AraC family transcriptional regulator